MTHSRFSKNFIHSKFSQNEYNRCHYIELSERGI